MSDLCVLCGVNPIYRSKYITDSDLCVKCGEMCDEMGGGVYEACITANEGLNTECSVMLTELDAIIGSDGWR